MLYKELDKFEIKDVQKVKNKKILSINIKNL